METKWIVRKGEDKVAGPYKNVQKARNKVDKLDNEYGSYAHRVERTEPREESVGAKEMSEGEQDLWIHKNPKWGIKPRLKSNRRLK